MRPASTTTATKLTTNNKHEKNHRRRTICSESIISDNDQKRQQQLTNKMLIDLETLEKELPKCQTGSAARNVLERALLQGKQEDKVEQTTSKRPPSSQPCLYGSITIPPNVSTKSISEAELAIQTNIRNSKFKVMELIEVTGDRDADRASLSLLSITVASFLSALVANQNLPGPDIIRFLVVWALCFAPLAFVGYGLVLPSNLQSLLVSIQRGAFPSYRKRMIQHEAGHFLLGHLLGWPIRDYSANAVRNAVEFYPLSDFDVGKDRAAALGFDVKRNKKTSESRGDSSVGGGGGGGWWSDLDDEQQQQQQQTEFDTDTPFFSEGGRGGDLVSTRSVFRNAKNYTNNSFLKLPVKDEPTMAWPYRGFDRSTLDKLAVISLGGVCAEILTFGNAEGGYADLSQLRQMFQSAQEELTEGEMANLVRFAVGYATSQLRRHLGALDALAEVMERDGSVAECVIAIETCANVRGGDALLGEGTYERQRREKFRSEGVAWLEQLLLGGGKNADVEDKSIIEGKGGGDRKKKFELTGDDPFYAALAVAAVFLVWPSTGGLSLH